MEFDELLITTGVDALVRLVKEKQRLELEDASTVLNIPTETIEDWARVLEEEGILKIEYKLTKTFISWIRPSAEEIETEKRSFYEEKASVNKEVEEVQGKVVLDTAGLEDLRRSFSDFYTKAYPRIEAMEKRVANIPSSKSIGDDTLVKYRTELEGMEGKLSETDEALAEMKKEVDDLGVGRKGSEGIIQRIEKMNAELAAYKNQMDELRASAGREDTDAREVQMPSSRDMKKKFDMIQKEFTTLRSKNAQMRQDMLSLHESSEILRSVAESVMGQDDKIAQLKGEMEALVSQAGDIETKTKAISKEVKKNADLLERLGDSVDVAKSVLKKFPAQEKVLLELDKLKSDEETILEKSVALETILAAAGGKQLSAKQFNDVVKKMDERMGQMRKDMDLLETTLEDEKSTYLTFQKIREKVVPSIESFQSQLSAMEQRVKNIRAESSDQMSAIRSEAKTLQQSLKGGEVQDAMKLADEIHEKKKTMDDIQSSLEELASMSDNINKRITLLSREAKLLEIRSSGAAPSSAGAGSGQSGGGGGGVETSSGKTTSMGLTSEEEMEFRQKREELKKLISKLWEQ